MLPKLDPLLHSELRLGVMSILAGVESADFTFIKKGKPKHSSLTFINVLSLKF